MIDFSKLEIGREYIITYKHYKDCEDNEFRITGFFDGERHFHTGDKIPIGNYMIKSSNEIVFAVAVILNNDICKLYDHYYKFFNERKDIPSFIACERIVSIEETNKSKSLINRELYD